MRTAGSAYVVVMGGALRSTSLVALEVVIDQLACLAFDQLILDVTELTAVDAAGASLLVGLRRWARDRGGPLALVGASADLTTALA
jgi:ABC-type transporter Mla MlaB component